MKAKSNQICESKGIRHRSDVNGSDIELIVAKGSDGDFD